MRRSLIIAALAAALAGALWLGRSALDGTASSIAAHGSSPAMAVEPSPARAKRDVRRDSTALPVPSGEAVHAAPGAGAIAIAQGARPVLHSDVQAVPVEEVDPSALDPASRARYAQMRAQHVELAAARLQGVAESVQSDGTLADAEREQLIAATEQQRKQLDELAQRARDREDARAR